MNIIDVITPPIRVPIEDIGIDGVDHINIHSRKAKTKLGRLIALESRVDFTHPDLGKFDSLEGFWHYLVTPGHPEEYRTMDPFAIKFHARSKGKQNRYPRFRNIVMDAMYLKIIQNPQLKELFIANELPFDFYYSIRACDLKHRKNNSVVKGDRAIIRPEGLDFMITALEDIRKLMLIGRTPLRTDVFTYIPTLAVRHHAPEHKDASRIT